MNHTRRTFVLMPALALVIVAALAGCQSTRKGTAPSAATTGNGGQPLSPDQIVMTDACAARLHDIGGALLFYVAVNKSLPVHLADVRNFSDANTMLEFKCPISGQDYVYVPDGLIAPSQTKRIILHDATPAHDGKRWCIFMAAPDRPGAAQSIEVLAVPEGVFQTYLPAAVGR